MIRTAVDENTAPAAGVAHGRAGDGTPADGVRDRTLRPGPVGEGWATTGSTPRL